MACSVLCTDDVRYVVRKEMQEFGHDPIWVCLAHFLSVGWELSHISIGVSIVDAGCAV